MKFSMNGFRRQLSNDVEALKLISKAIIAGDFYDEEEFVDAVNDLIIKSNVINCVFQDDDEDFSDMSDLEVDHIEPITN